MKLTRTLIPALALLLLLNSCGARDDPQPHENPPPTVEITELTQERKEPVEEETDPVREYVKETEEASNTDPTEPDHDRLHRQYDPHLSANCRGGHAACRASADRKEAPLIDEPTLQCTG